LHTLFRARI